MYTNCKQNKNVHNATIIGGVVAFQAVQDVPRLSPKVIWERLQHTREP